MIGTNVKPRSAVAQQILAQIAPTAQHSERPALVVLAGLPGAGKTHVASELRARTGATVVESDEMRRLLFPARSYRKPESRRLFAAIHEAIDALVADGITVVLDATNVREDEREPLYDIAERRNARLIVVEVTAHGDIIRERLSSRSEDDLSEARQQVYNRMLARMEEIQRPHHVVDTSKDIEAAVAAIAKEMTARE